MKRTILALALLGACLFGFSGQAKAGMTTYRIETSTPVNTAILLQSGVGSLYSIDCSSGATTSYTMAFDSGSSTGITVNTKGSAISPQVYSAGTSFVASATWKPGTGNESITFYNGLVAIINGAPINCLYRVGPNQGSIP